MAATVAQRGYQQTAVADVLATARISRRTFYETFRDKQDCFLAAYDAFSARCERDVQRACDAGATTEESITMGLEALLRLLAGEPAYARLAVVEVLAAGDAGRARRDAALRRYASGVDAARARRRDDRSERPALVAQAVVGGIYELIYSYIIRDATEQLPALREPLTHFASMLLGGPRAAR